MKKYFFLLIFILSVSFLKAQEKIKMKLADIYFDKYSYSEAIPLYEDLAKKNSANVHFLSRTAECYRLTGNTQKAEEWYAKLTGMENTDPANILYYAEMLNGNKKYEEANKYYAMYKEKNNSDSRAARKLNTAEQLQLLYRDSSHYKVTNLNINSKNSDFGLFPFGGETFFFASNRVHEKYSKHTYNWNNQPFLDLYTVKRNADGSFASAQPIPGEVNSQYHEGPIFLDANTNTFYVTRNNYNENKFQKSKDGVNKLKLYIVDLGGTSSKTFSEFPYNNNEYSVGHATLSKDGQRLYFVSDMPGGIGGTDIYVSALEGGKWGTPKNLGNEINTEGNEMFPLISQDGKLYFSSDGFYGLGGLDVYSAKMENDGFDNPKNLGSPINSNKDDFSFYASADSKTGFFSSNRAGGKGDDDIYSFELIKPLKTELKGIVKDEKDGSPISSAKVKLQGADGNPMEAMTDANGIFSFEADWNMNYSLEAGKEKFTTAKKSIATSVSSVPFNIEMRIKKNEFILEGMIVNKENNSPLADATATITTPSGESKTIASGANGNFSIALEPNNNYTIKIEKPKFMTSTIAVSTSKMEPGVIKKYFSLEELKAGKTFKIENVYYDLGKWDIRSDAKPELDKLVAIMMENPTMAIELGSHTDSRGSDASNLSLSDKRAKSAAAYIVSKGISKDKIIGKGYGETQLINRCKNGVKCSDEEFQMNRRTEIKILTI